MNWLTNFVRPKIKALVGAADDGETRWTKCPACGQMIYRKELIEARHVCPNCGHHMRLPATERLALLFDDGHYEKVTLDRSKLDPIKFRDIRRYTERLKEAQTRTGENDAILVATGSITGIPAVIAIFDFTFMGGSMGMAVGDGLLAAARLAVDRKCPLIAIPASGGARMQEGILSLMQLPRTIIAVQMVKEAGLPYVVLLTDPTTGGVSASFAMLGDIAMSEPGAIIGFAGSRVIEETIRETLPDGFQRAEYLLDHGMVDMVVKRSELRETLGRILGLLMQSTKEKLSARTAMDRASL
ncbi:MAG: acetyl-CoA carboxylase, carboxyltransferase subunit beta [Alphaproteobacteria bacterium]